MALNKANISWSAKQIAKMASNGTFTFDNVIQRSYVWEQTRKSNLIHSLIEGFPVPPFYAKKVDGKTYDFLDGKQRINAIRAFIENEYYLLGVPDVTYTNAEGNEVTIELDGKFFKNLPEELQDAIKDYHLTVYYYEDITPEQVRMLFAKLNNGKPLSTKERNIANCVDIITVSDIGKHELFQNVLTEKALNARKQIPIVMKIWMMLNRDIEDVSFESKDFNDVMKETVISEDQKNEIVDVLDKIYAVYNELENYSNAKIAKTARTKMVSETHLVSLAPFFALAICEGICDRLMGDFMVELFGHGVVVSEAYADVCKGGSAKNANIKVRHNEINRKWGEFFATDCTEESENWEDVTDEEPMVDEAENQEESVEDADEPHYYSYMADTDDDLEDESNVKNCLENSEEDTEIITVDFMNPPEESDNDESEGE